LLSVSPHTVRTIRSTVKTVLLILVFSSVCNVISAQNTKGDRPASNKKQTRETRFKTKSRQGEQAKTKDIAGRRLRTKGKSSESKANASYPKPRYATLRPRQGKERAGQSYRPAYSSSPRGSEKGFSGSTPRKRVAVRSVSSSASRRNVYSPRGTRSVSSQSSRRNIYSQRNPYVNNPSRKPKDTQRAWRGSASGSRIKVRSITAQVKKQNVYSKQGGSFRNYRSPIIQSPVSNRSQVAKAKRYRSQPTSPTRKVTVTPRSASRSFIRSKSINPYAGFFRVKRKGEQVTTKDIAGRTLRTRNYRTPAQPILLPEQDPYRGRKRTGERAYKGPAAGYNKSATASNPKAWTGDIAGRKIRGRNYESPRRGSNKSIYPPKLSKAITGDHAKHTIRKGTGYRSFSTGGGKVGLPIPVKTPGEKSDQLGQYQNRLTGRRPVKGGGSISGKRWNNEGQPISPRQPGLGINGVNYSGNMKAAKPIKGGGSISGKVWNNNGQPLIPREPGIGAKGILSSGTIKASKPLKGGGSISGKLWNNNGQPILVRTPPEEAAKAAKYPGNFKHFELYPSMGDQGEEFTGFIKRGKYSKSPHQHANALVKRNLKNVHATDGLHIHMKQPGWARNKNAHPHALLKRDLGGNVFETGGLQIRVKSPSYVQNKNANEQSILKRKPSPTSYQINSLTTKLKQPGWARNKNAHEDALLKRDPGSNVFETAGLQIKMQSPGYAQNKNAHSESILKRKPSRQTLALNNLTAKVKQPGWVKNKNAHTDALMKRDPGSAVFAVDKIYGKIKAYNYQSNPSSSRDALKVREPGKAFAKAANYQGNIKMQKFNFFKHPDYHPDASFVKTNKNNVKEERDLLTNIRLFWAKLFRKSENQPDHLKEKVRKPRYDNREVGLWYD
jgi:hypothetical protein